MISGTVTSLLEMVIPLPVRDSTGTIHEIEVVVDTGFTGSLSLPRSVIGSLVSRGAPEAKQFLPMAR